MMWWRLSAGSCLEGNPAVPLYVGPQPWVLDRLGEDFDRTTKSLTDSALKSDHADKIHLGSWIELNCEINIAFSFSITASDGAKQR